MSPNSMYPPSDIESLPGTFRSGSAGNQKSPVLSTFFLILTGYPTIEVQSAKVTD